MKNILLTGSTGFVGKQIIKALINKNVCIFPTCRPGREEIIKNIPNIKKVIKSKDIFQEDEAWWAKQCEDIDIIIHNAWSIFEKNS